MPGANDPDCRRGMCWDEEYQDKGPVLYAKRIEAAEPPEEELVYF